MKQILLLLFVAVFQQVNAQSIKIKERVVSWNLPLDNAFVAVFLSDMVLLGSAFSDSDGNFVVLSPKVDSFFVKVEHENIGTFTSTKQTDTSFKEIECVRSSEIDEVVRTTMNNRGSLVGGVSAISSFTARKGWSFEWNGYYHTKEVYAFDSIRRITFTGIAVQKKFQDGKCILKMALTDVFFSNSIRANVAFTDYRESFIVKRDTRVATVSFTYKFGKASVRAGRRRRGGAEGLKS